MIVSVRGYGFAVHFVEVADISRPPRTGDGAPPVDSVTAGGCEHPCAAPRTKGTVCREAPQHSALARGRTRRPLEQLLRADAPRTFGDAFPRAARHSLPLLHASKFSAARRSEVLRELIRALALNNIARLSDS